MCAIECHSKYVLEEHRQQQALQRLEHNTYLTNVNTMPGHRNTTLAIARPFLRYFNGLPAYSSSSPWSLDAFGPVTYALCVATMYVYASAHDSVNIHANTEQTFHAIFTPLDSRRSGQKRSKKKALPKMVAT